jgi:dihydroflavonol-4-reductase
MKVLVLGASGHIGNAIVRKLIDDGHAVTGTARRASRPLNLAGLDIDYRAGDIDRGDTLDEWLEGQDVVIDSAAPYAINLLTSSSTAEGSALERARSRVERLISALDRHSARLIYVSSAHTDPSRKPGSLWGWQRRLARAVYPYFAIKRLTEDRVVAAMRAGLRATIFRPTACLGPWDIKPRNDCWIPKLLKGEIPGILSHRVNVLDTRDLAAAIAAAVDGTGNGETILLSGHNTTTDEVIEQLCASGDVPVPAVRIPAEISVIPLLWVEALWAMIGTASPLPSLVPALLCEQTWLEASEFQSKLGIGPRPLEETASDTVTWYRSLGYC